jgi:phasin family protein
VNKEKNTSSFHEEFLNSFKNTKYPWLNMKDLMSAYQENMDLMNKTQQIAVETTQAVMELQSKFVQNAFDMWSAQVKDCCSKAPAEEKTATQAEYTKERIDKTMEHLRDLNAVITKSNKKISESIQKRVQEGLDESLNRAKKNK